MTRNCKRLANLLSQRAAKREAQKRPGGKRKSAEQENNKRREPLLAPAFVGGLGYWSGIPGSTGVPSTRTAFRAEGAIPRAFRMVGATWAVPTAALTVRGWKPGNDTSSMT